MADATDHVSKKFTTGDERVERVKEAIARVKFSDGSFTKDDLRCALDISNSAKEGKWVNIPADADMSIRVFGTRRFGSTRKVVRSLQITPEYKFNAVWTWDMQFSEQWYSPMLYGVSLWVELEDTTRKPPSAEVVCRLCCNNSKLMTIDTFFFDLTEAAIKLVQKAKPRIREMWGNPTLPGQMMRFIANVCETIGIERVKLNDGWEGNIKQNYRIFKDGDLSIMSDDIESSIEYVGKAFEGARKRKEEVERYKRYRKEQTAPEMKEEEYEARNTHGFYGVFGFKKIMVPDDDEVLSASVADIQQSLFRCEM